MSKGAELLKSRRLWAAVVGVVAAVVCFVLGYIEADKMATWIGTSIGVYQGSLGVEHVGGVIAGAAKAAKKGSSDDRDTSPSITR